MKVCKNCGEVNTNDSTFCCNCGQSNFTARKEIVCPHCQAVNDSTYAFCVNCGLSLASAPSEGNSALSGDVTKFPDVENVGLTSIPSEAARCPHCGGLVAITEIFCPNCGVSVANLHSHRVVQRKICPHCGRPNGLDADMCYYCFGSLAEAATEEMQLTHHSVNLGELTVRQACLESVSGKNVICPNCGTLNPEDEVFCCSCGLKLVIEEPKRYCPDCGAENSADSTFCARCRHSFDGVKPDRVEMWTCDNCNHVNEQDDLFCTNCGQRKS